MSRYVRVSHLLMSFLSRSLIAEILFCRKNHAMRRHLRNGTRQRRSHHETVNVSHVCSIERHGTIIY